MIFKGERGSLEVYLGALGIANFFSPSLRASYYISALRLLSFSKNGELVFFEIFESEHGGSTCSVVLASFSIFL